MVIDRDDVNKVHHSMFKIMEDIFTGTIKRVMGSEESVVTVATSGNGGKANLSNTKGIPELESKLKVPFQVWHMVLRKLQSLIQYYNNAV